MFNLPAKEKREKMEAYILTDDFWFVKFDLSSIK